MAGPADATPVVEAQKRAPAELKAVVDFLRGKNGPKVRRGILNGKRVDYFKGKTAIRTLTGPAYQKLKKVPVVKDEDEAKALLVKLLPHAFFLRVDRPTTETPTPSGQPKPVQLAPQQSLDPQAYYAWFYDGSPLTTILGAIAMVVVMLAAVMFPLWPVKLRLGVWYLSILALGLLGALLVLAVVRLVIWCVTVVAAKRAIWIFPNLFEDVGFFESFVPTWAYDEPKKKKRKVKRGGDGKSKKTDGDVEDDTAAQGGVGETVKEDDSTSTARATGVDISASGAGANGPAPTSTSTLGGGQGLQRRMQASIEEIEDDGE